MRLANPWNFREVGSQFADHYLTRFYVISPSVDSGLPARTWKVVMNGVWAWSPTGGKNRGLCEAPYHPRRKLGAESGFEPLTFWL